MAAVQTENLHLKDFPDSVRDEVCDRLAMYTVGIMRNVRADRLESSFLIGTGTLISCAGFDCILTADHVLAELRSTDLLGLMTSFSGDLRHYSFEQSVLQICRIARGTDDAH